MSDIPTWHERAMRHPDHQTGMVSEGMIRQRMWEEIMDLRAEVKRLRGALEMVRDADNDCRLDGLTTIPDIARRKIDEALEGGP